MHEVFYRLISIMIMKWLTISKEKKNKVKANEYGNVTGEVEMDEVLFYSGNVEFSLIYYCYKQ